MSLDAPGLLDAGFAASARSRRRSVSFDVMHEKSVTLCYSEQLVRAAVKAFWFKSTGWSYFAALAVVMGALVYLLAIGSRSWVVGALGMVVAMGVAMAVVLYIVHYRGALLRLRRMRTPQAVLHAGHDSFKLVSDVGTSELSWRAVREIWRFPEFWLLFISRAQFITLPIAALEWETQQFILERVEAHGGRIA
jgi:hypothetical protein